VGPSICRQREREENGGGAIYVVQGYELSEFSNAEGIAPSDFQRENVVMENVVYAELLT
jgi:hypothetical protein